MFHDNVHGILNYCRHKVPFGVVEAINGDLRALIRRAGGYRDHQYLVLKAQRTRPGPTDDGRPGLADGLTRTVTGH